MAVTPFPRPDCSIPSTCAFYHSPYFYHLCLRRQSCSARSSNLVKFRARCSQQTIQFDAPDGSRPIKVPVDTIKKKRKPKPSFFEQIRGKWSLRIDSTREKFPWQEKEQQSQGEHVAEELEEQDSELMSQRACDDAVLSEREKIADSSVTTNVVPCVSNNRSTLPPWFRGDKLPPKPYFGAEDEVTQISAVEGMDDVRSNFDESEVKACNEVSRRDYSGKLVREENREKFPPNFSRRENLKLASGVVSGGDAFSDEEDLEKSDEFGRPEVLGERSHGSVELPWMRDDVERKKKKSNTDLAERVIPEHELTRLRNVALRMLERIKVGDGGITQPLVDSIHEKWRVDEVVKLKFEGAHSTNMKRTHEILESRTGGLVIWRSGSSVVLYRGITYKFPCVQSFSKQKDANASSPPCQEDIGTDATQNVGGMDSFERSSLIADSAKYMKGLSEEELMDMNNLSSMLDELGPRFMDWSGREPVPVDADLLPSVVPGYKPPFRLLPYGVRHCLRNKEMMMFRRLARTMPPHFALGRNRKLQGLALAMVKLWERSAIAKIAIKRGVLNTCNDRMAEELKTLTGGTLLSRNKDYIVFYRGNDFLPPVVVEALKEREKLTDIQASEEDQARRLASVAISSKFKASKSPLVAGTLAETLAATSRWGNELSSKDIEQMRRDESLNKQASLVRYLEKKLALAKGKMTKAEKALAKVQENLKPSELPCDLETMSDEERSLFRKIGLSMKPFLLIGKRGIFDGTIENIHLHWKYRELVKLIVRGKSFAQVKHLAISLEAETGGVLVSLDRTTKGYAIIIYRGKNYQRPHVIRPRNLLTRRQALFRSIELQRREALKHHISDLQERIQLLKSELEETRINNEIDEEKRAESFLAYQSIDETSDDEGEEAYLRVYDTEEEDALQN